MTHTLPDTPADETAAPQGRRNGVFWGWILAGVFFFVGLGIFMWAVDGRLNTTTPSPAGPAATPAEAVEKFLAAVDNHDAELARSYAGETMAPQVDDWIDRAGYVRLLSAEEATATDDTGAAASLDGAAPPPGAKTLDVTYEAVTRFLSDDHPLGLNLLALVWTEEVSHPWIVAPSADGSGWVVEDGGKPLRK